MDMKRKIAALTAAVAMLAAPTAAATASPGHEGEHPAHPAHPAHPEHPTPGPKASLPEKAKAYGVYCRGLSKQHVAGEKGTEFSRCVVAAAKVKKEESAG
jgi:hypothetical protein